MNCPTCGAPTVVLETRGKMRRRRCKINPDHVFETTEQITHIGARHAGPGRPVKVRTQQARWAGLE